ncbi:MAG: flagellar biosynthetic protein FliO, partial [Clostridiales bacterium]|nr:flagellar biosynthetic protein FliO [Clostridiales bacterium]
NMKVIERIALTQDKGMAIVEICSKYYLVSFSNNSVDIIKELDNESDKLLLDDNSSSSKGLDFISVFQKTLKERKGNKKDV